MTDAIIRISKYSATNYIFLSFYFIFQQKIVDGCVYKNDVNSSSTISILTYTQYVIQNDNNAHKKIILNKKIMKII